MRLPARGAGTGDVLFPCRKRTKSTLKGAVPLENPLNALFCLPSDETAFDSTSMPSLVRRSSAATHGVYRGISLRRRFWDWSASIAIGAARPYGTGR